jgi:hypothetical protein
VRGAGGCLTATLFNTHNVLQQVVLCETHPHDQHAPRQQREEARSDGAHRPSAHPSRSCWQRDGLKEGEEIRRSSKEVLPFVRVKPLTRSQVCETLSSGEDRPGGPGSREQRAAHPGSRLIDPRHTNRLDSQARRTTRRCWCCIRDTCKSCCVSSEPTRAWATSLRQEEAICQTAACCPTAITA